MKEDNKRVEEGNCRERERERERERGEKGVHISTGGRLWLEGGGGGQERERERH